jgi:hypothetical protein
VTAPERRATTRLAPTSNAPDSRPARRRRRRRPPAPPAGFVDRTESWLVLDELCQWSESTNARRFHEALVTALPKLAGSRLVIITTSGDPSHWSRKVYDAAVADRARWRVSEAEGPPPWMEPAEVEAARRELPDSAFARLFLNKWAATEDRLFRPTTWPRASPWRARWTPTSDTATCWASTSPCATTGRWWRAGTPRPTAATAGWSWTVWTCSPPTRVTTSTWPRSRSASVTAPASTGGRPRSSTRPVAGR